MRALLVFALLVSSGCSSIWVEAGQVRTVTTSGAVTVRTEAENRGERRSGIGITYYEPMLVAVVGCGDGGHPTVTIATLPDLSRPRVVRWRDRLIGSVDPEVTIRDGWRLESFGGEASSGGDELLSIAAALVGEVPGLVTPDGDPETRPLGPGVYRLRWTGTRWEIESDPLIRLAACS